MTPVGWLVFWLLVLMAAVLLLRSRRRRRGGARGVPPVRLVVLARDRAAVVEGFVRELLRITANTPQLTVVAVDQGSRDETPTILERLGRRLPVAVRRWEGRSAGDGREPALAGLSPAGPVTVVIDLNAAEDPRGILLVVDGLARAVRRGGAPAEGEGHGWAEERGAT